MGRTDLINTRRLTAVTKETLVTRLSGEKLDAMILASQERRFDESQRTTRVCKVAKHCRCDYDRDLVRNAALRLVRLTWSLPLPPILSLLLHSPFLALLHDKVRI